MFHLGTKTSENVDEFPSSPHCLEFLSDDALTLLILLLLFRYPLVLSNKNHSRTLSHVIVATRSHLCAKPIRFPSPRHRDISKRLLEPALSIPTRTGAFPSRQQVFTGLRTAPTPTVNVATIQDRLAKRPLRRIRSDPVVLALVTRSPVLSHPPSSPQRHLLKNTTVQHSI